MADRAGNTNEKSGRPRGLLTSHQGLEGRVRADKGLMTSERWRQIEQIYDAALQHASGERDRFLDAACRGDETLRREVERLIFANEQAGDFLGSPAWEAAPSGLVATMMTNDRDMSLVGRQIGRYEIIAPLGRGGMGDVYRAHDSTLNREVAVKVLPDLFAHDADRVARFKREAHVLASLNHPNIAAIHGFEDAGDVKALVLELVDGPTLADRIARGRIALAEALPIARQIADALEAAHERGIVHRDLKPANIKVRTDGMVKVLDFGLAKAVDPQSMGDPSQSPTLGSPVVTREGIILGTAAYMAPEQARGKAADKRSDLWAFGCVLFEMLSGRRAFAGEDTSETLAAVIKDDPDWGALPNETPASIRRLLRRCLAKDPKRRLSDAAVARIEIDDAFVEPQFDTSATQTRSRRKERFAWAFALLLAAAAAIAAVVLMLRPQPPAEEVSFEIHTPPTTDTISLAVSPDGQKIVFVAIFEGRNKLWLRRLDSASAEPLAGTDGAAAPFWSPDSRSVAFFSTPTIGSNAWISMVDRCRSLGPFRSVPAERGIETARFSFRRSGQCHSSESPPMVARLLRSRQERGSCRASCLMVVTSSPIRRSILRRPRSLWATSKDQNRCGCSKRILPRRMCPQGTSCSAGKERSSLKPSTPTDWC